MRDLVLAAEKTLPDGEPSAAVLARIQSAAAERANERVIAFPRPMMIGIACAAASVLLMGGWFLFPRDGRAQRISDIHVILAMVAEEEAVGEPYEVAAEGKEDLRVLAYQLLLIEGMVEEESTGIDGAIPDEELQPTAFRLRNTPGPAPRRCV